MNAIDALIDKYEKMKYDGTLLDRIDDESNDERQFELAEWILIDLRALKEKAIEGCACNEGTWDFCEVKLVDGKCPICQGGKPAILLIDD